VNTDFVFRTKTPAPRWEDGALTGSGRVGAIVHGEPDDLRISLAHERFFLPANPRRAAPDLRGALPSLRAAVDEAHDGAGTTEALTAALTGAGFTDLIWTDPLALCAVIAVRTPGGAHGLERSMDLARGLVTISWRDDDGGTHRIRVVAPRAGDPSGNAGEAGGDRVIIAVESELDAVVSVWLGLDVQDDGPAASFAPDYTGVVHARVAEDVPRLEVVDRQSRTRAVVTPHPDASGARWRVGDAFLAAELAVPGGGRRVLSLDIAIDGFTSTEGAAAAPDWDALLRAQEQVHGSLVKRSLLDLGGAAEDTTVEDLWARAHRGEAEAIRRAIEVAYTAGRSHIIAATGELPATLQGVWQGTWKPAWSADYTMNGNVQNGTAAALISTGTPELMRSLLTLVLEHLDDYRDNARRIFGADGMLLPSRMSTHGIANHGNADFPHMFWVGAGGWTLRLIADLVSTTGDRTIVDGRVWALAEGVLRFAETAVIGEGGAGRLIPSYSPENTPAGASSPLAVDATMDVAILRDAARASSLLGRARGDDSLDARWARVVAALPDYRVASDGTLAEWIDPRWDENIAHRHASQLYPLWYEPDEAFAGASPSATALRSAARATIAAKIAWRAEDPTAPPGRMEMAFGLAQIGLAAAALGDADAARTCVEWLTLLHWRPALTTTHDAGSIMNLDASGALPAVVAAMLVGSTLDSVTLLPALPDEWPTGEVTGLRARAGIVVERISWDEHGARAVLRRLPAASWLAPGGAVTVLPGAGFRIERDETDDAGSLPLRLGADPVEIRLIRRHPGAG